MKPLVRARFAFALCAALALSSCEAFFSTNLFTKLLPPKDYTSLSSTELKSEAYTRTGILATGFIAYLKANPTARTEVLATLDLAMQNTSYSGAEKQEALALYVDIQLATTEAGTVVNNVVSALTSVSTVDFTMTASDAVDFVKSLLPAALLTDETAFKDMITTLKDVDDKVRNRLGDTVEGNYNVGNLAQAALVAALVAGVQPASQNTSIENALWAAITGDTNAISGITPPNFDTGPLATLLGAAGINLSSNP